MWVSGHDKTCHRHHPVFSLNEPSMSSTLSYLDIVACCSRLYLQYLHYSYTIGLFTCKLFYTFTHSKTMNVRLSQISVVHFGIWKVGSRVGVFGFQNVQCDLDYPNLLGPRVVWMIVLTHWAPRSFRYYPWAKQLCQILDSFGVGPCVSKIIQIYYFLTIESLQNMPSLYSCVSDLSTNTSILNRNLFLNRPGQHVYQKWHTWPLVNGFSETKMIHTPLNVVFLHSVKVLL